MQEWYFFPADRCALAVHYYTAGTNELALLNITSLCHSLLCNQPKLTIMCAVAVGACRRWVDAEQTEGQYGGRQQDSGSRAHDLTEGPGAPALARSWDDPSPPQEYLRHHLASTHWPVISASLPMMGSARSLLLAV
ncbi:hypothetical protein BGW80DRAFT_1248863 [Lactifluus volemus]|nr:hypothetical protein BGW80DRAFT_1248863 [Lactifluus volemus]